MVVVPCGMTAAANSAGVNIPLSMCMWPSQSPGIINFPLASKIVVFGPMQ